MTDGTILLHWLKARGYSQTDVGFIATTERGQILVPHAAANAWFDKRHPERFTHALRGYELEMLHALRTQTIEWRSA